MDSSPYHEQQHVSFNSTSAPTAYLAWMADSQIRHGMTKGFDYGTAVVYKGFERAIALTRNQTLVDFYHDQLFIVQDNGTITGYNYSYYSLDQYRIGMSLLYWYTHHDNTSSSPTPPSSPSPQNNTTTTTTTSKYAHAATLIRAMLDTHPRNPQGGFWHRSPAYPDQIWGDSIFMGTSFYALYTSVFEPYNTSAWDDVTLQYTLYYTHCLNLNNDNNHNNDNGTPPNNTTKTKTNNRLLKHGYDASKSAVWANPITGASPLVWARADGWFFTSLLETLQVIPTTHPGHATLLGYFQSLAEGLLVAQQQQEDHDSYSSSSSFATGAGGFGWWLIMDEEYIGVEGNYIESSATAMFTNGFFEGVRLGFLDAQRFLEPAKRAYRMMVEKWVVVVGSNNGTGATDEGTLNWEGTVEVGSLGSNATFQYYTSEPVDENDYKGIGPFMWASYETAVSVAMMDQEPRVQGFMTDVVQKRDMFMSLGALLQGKKRNGFPLVKGMPHQARRFLRQFGLNQAVACRTLEKG